MQYTVPCPHCTHEQHLDKLAAMTLVLTGLSSLLWLLLKPFGLLTTEGAARGTRWEPTYPQLHSHPAP